LLLGLLAASVAPSPRPCVSSIVILLIVDTEIIGVGGTRYSDISPNY